MDEMIYIAMTGARQTEQAQTVNSNNLANASTTGFRADLHAFTSVPIDGPGVGSRVNAVLGTPGIDFTAGPVVTTGDELDIAIQGNGFIAVQAPDGTEAYTRAGNLDVDAATGLLQTAAGHLVVGNGGPVALPPNAKVEIGSDGTISVIPEGQTPDTLSEIDRIKLVNPPLADLERRGDGLLALRDGEIAPADASVTVQAGQLEQSNVNVASTLVNMIELARQYEMQVNLIKTSEENADAAAQLMRLG